MMTATQIPVGAPSFFASSTLASGDSGMPFDMGLRCVSQPVNIQKLNSGGTIPIMGAPTISVFLGTQPGETNYFQYWYRNGSGPCTGTVNSTNAIEVTWGL
ncbi:MAG: hypothetical protein ACI8X5_001982 [Planctomycetota bacterium]|jgi:hypothetical protein